MSFSEHLDNFIKQRDQQSSGKGQGQTFQRKHVVLDPTNQSLAREAMAKAQEDASQQATLDTKQPHYRINGRCVTENEAQTLHQLEYDSEPANPDRVEYINELRKKLKLKKRS
ncbi:hypothetical protein [Photobacterium nomapromontoriensis]|uniref:hypothetical protein n=1 Tax=Photobacterium nomapromontoriensis TaxID=2910237 RepID=UPI003D136784